MSDTSFEQEFKDLHTLHHFGAGPSAIPESVLRPLISDGLLSYRSPHKNSPLHPHGGVGFAQLEHKSVDVQRTLDECKNTMASLLGVDLSRYDILFNHGGASAHFSAIPMNLVQKGRPGNYIITGLWSQHAATEYKKFCGGQSDCHMFEMCDMMEETHCTTITDPSTWKKPQSPASYTLYCDNETVHGLEFRSLPLGDQYDESLYGPLVCDMASSLMTKPVQVDRYGLIFSTTHKNLGVPGMGICIIRRDLLSQDYRSKLLRGEGAIPSMFDYKVLSEQNSLYNCPSLLSLYSMYLMMQIRIRDELGGVEGVDRHLRSMTSRIYDYIDKESRLMVCEIDPQYRSRLNVICHFKNDDDQSLRDRFVREAEEFHEGRKVFFGMKGWEGVDGLRISCFAGTETESVDHLLDFMRDFEEKVLEERGRHIGSSKA